MRDSLRKWQSPPDPSTSHNFASDRQHEGTAEWFIKEDKFEEWKSSGALLWIHGKRKLLLLMIAPVILRRLWDSQRGLGKAFYGALLLKSSCLGKFTIVY